MELEVNFRFVNLGLNSHPTFFGCNASNFTSYGRTPPLVIYFPHVPWTAFTNWSTFTLQYSQAEVQAYITNGVATAVSCSCCNRLTASLKETVPRGLHVLHVPCFKEQKNVRVFRWAINAPNVSRNIVGMGHSTRLPMRTIRCSDLTMGPSLRTEKEAMEPRVRRVPAEP